MTIIIRQIRLFLLITLILSSSVILAGCQVEVEPTPIPLAAAGSEPATPVFVPTPTLPKPLNCEDEELLCVGLVTGAGQIDDKSFNQSAWEGVKRAKRDLGARIDFIHTTKPVDYPKNIEYFAEQHYDVIVTVGFNVQASTAQAAANYPHIDFIGVDHNYAFVENNTNVSGLVFSEKKAGFLAGALAAMLTETGVIGAVLSTDLMPPIVEFKRGYIIGARAVDPTIQVLHEHHPGAVNQAFIDSDWGEETAREMIDAGADVIFGVGGLTGNGALLEAANYDDVFCIGADTDQWKVLPEAHNCLISSAMKQIDEGVFELIAWSLVGETKTGNFAGNVQLAPFHNFDEEITAEARSFLNELKREIDEGNIPLNGSYTHPSPPRAFGDDS